MRETEREREAGREREKRGESERERERGRERERLIQQKVYRQTLQHLVNVYARTIAT